MKVQKNSKKISIFVTYKEMKTKKKVKKGLIGLIGLETASP